MPEHEYRDLVCLPENEPPQQSLPPEFQQSYGNQAESDSLFCPTELEQDEQEEWLQSVDPAWMATLDTVPTEQRGIEICKRIAEIPVAEQLGLKHWWIRTDQMEVGMGPITGEVPSVDGDKGDYPGAPTMITDHTGQADNTASTCVPAAEWNPDWDNVDIDCLEENNALGTKTGRWVPPFNDCHTFVNRAMNACDPDVQAAEAQEATELHEWYEGQRYMEQTHPGRY